MKRVMFVLMSAIILVSTLGFNVFSASAGSLISYDYGIYVWGKGIVFVFDASGYKNKDVRDASIFVGSNFHHLGCTANKQEEKIVCVAQGGLTQYAFQTGIIHLAGQLFYVTIPDRVLPKQSDQPLDCGEFETPGANVTFYYGEGAPDTFFIEGNTMTEVQQAAQNIMDDSEGFVISFQIVSGLMCGEIPT